MSKVLIPPTKSLGYSDFYLEFVQGSNRASEFFLAESQEAVASRIDQTKYDRELMRLVLKRQNTLYGASDETFKNIDKLSDPKSVCLFAGQQAGLFGGPMYTTIKALAIVKAAREYEQQLGRPVIPIFWIAGDDHDFEEANHTYLLNRESELVRITYPSAPQRKVSLASVAFEDSDALNAAKEDYYKSLGQTEFTTELYSLIDDAYASGKSFVNAFGRLLAGLTAKFGLVLFNPADDHVKRHAASFFKRIVERQEELVLSIADTNQRLSESGFHLQVEKKETSTFLFYEQSGRLPLSGRLPIIRQGVDYVAGEKTFTKAELFASIEKHPEHFSTDVITRPLLQSYLFPALAQICGPSEIAYLAQINPLFDCFDLPVPFHQARPSVTVIEVRMEEAMSNWQLSFEDISGDIEDVVNRILSASFPAELEQHFERLRDDVKSRFEQFAEQSLKFDPSLEKIAKQTNGKIDFNLKTFEQKVFAAHKRASTTTRDRIYRLWHTLYPRRGFQDRTLNVGYFTARYGFEFIDFLYDQLDTNSSDHHLIHLSGRKQK